MIEDVRGGRLYTDDLCPNCRGVSCYEDECVWQLARGRTKESEVKSMGSKWEIGKQYKLSNGEVVQIVYMNVPGQYPILGFDISTGRKISWTAEGSFYSRGESYSDLTTEEYKEPEYRWINVYDGMLTSYRTKESADKLASSDRRGRVKLEVTELHGRWDD